MMVDPQSTANNDRRPPNIAGENPDLRPECLIYFGLPIDCTEKAVRDTYKRFAHACHPDQGGAADDFRELTVHYERALDYVRSRLADRRPNADYQAVFIDSFRFVRGQKENVFANRAVQASQSLRRIGRIRPA